MKKRATAGLLAVAVATAVLWPCCTLLACGSLPQATVATPVQAPCHNEAPAQQPEEDCPVCQLRLAAADRTDFNLATPIVLAAPAVVASPVPYQEPDLGSPEGVADAFSAIHRPIFLLHRALLI